MRKTPQEFKRVAVREVIEKVLGDTKTSLTPASISVSELASSCYTATKFSFEITGHKQEEVEITEEKGRGFVDNLFTGLHGFFSCDFNSLQRIKLRDLKVNPLIGSAKSRIGSDAPISVIFSLHVAKNGIAEFQHKSNSIINSSFVAILKAFEFYINCERAFDKIQIIVADAKRRNRGDIVSQSMYDLSKITEVNTYEREKRS